MNGSLRLVGGVTPSGERSEVTIRGGVVVDDLASADQTVDVDGAVVAPGLIDLQVNGAAGIDLTVGVNGSRWKPSATTPATRAEPPRADVTVLSPDLEMLATVTDGHLIQHGKA